jgi:hypothetical protein
MIERAARADDRCSRRARGAIAGLAFGIGHGCFTDRFAWYYFPFGTLRHETMIYYGKEIRRGS